MKKLSRSKKNMLIGKGKTIAIVLLCFSCLFFLSRIIELYSGQTENQGGLWGNAEMQTNTGSDSESVSDMFREMTKPQSLMINYGNGKYLLRYSEGEYGQLADLSERVIGEMYTRPKGDFEKTDIDSWNSAREGKSVFVTFACQRKTDFESGILSANGAGFSEIVSGYSELLLTVDDKGENAKAFVRDGESGNIFSVSAPNFLKELDDVIRKTASEEKQNVVFASELNLDKVGNDRVSLDSMFIVPFGEIRDKVVVAKVPKIYKEGLDFTNTTEFTVNLMNVFGFNQNTVRQYSDNDGKLIYVGETGTIRVSPDGQIEYKALTEKDGIPVLTSGKSMSDEYSVVSGISYMNKSVLRISGEGDEKNNSSLRLVNIPEGGNSSEVKVVMEYFVDNHKAVFGDTPAVEAIIKNGNLVEYKIKVKAIELVEKEVPCGDIMTAVDEFCNKNPNCKKITYGNLIYRISEDGIETPAVWEIKGE